MHYTSKVLAEETVAVFKPTEALNWLTKRSNGTLSLGHREGETLW